MTKYQITKANKLHIAQGNSKLGKKIYAFSTLPGNAAHQLTLKDGTQLINVAGTCSKHCDSCFNGGCYAVKSATFHHNSVIKAWAENTLLLQEGRVGEMVDKFLDNRKNSNSKNKTALFRINVSGELRSWEDVKMWDNIAKNHSNITFGVYTKNYEAVDEFMAKYNDTQPNFVINISQWHGCADRFLKKYPNKFNIFEYDDSNRANNALPQSSLQRLSQICHCPAVLETGVHAKTANGQNITCDMCGRCYRKTGVTTAVYAH